MKKHQIAATVGTLALVANLLLPNLAFGQDQNVGQDVGCPGAGTQTFAHIPANTTLTPLTAGTGGNTVDNSIVGSAVLSDNLLAITDTTSGGANGCTSIGGSVTASATNFVDPSFAVGNTIYADSLRLVTTTNVTSDAVYTGLFPAGSETVSNVIYSKASGPGDDHDVLAPQTVAAPATATLSATANVDAYTLTNPTQNKFGFGVAIDVLRYCTPKNSTFGTGVALALEGVPSTQAAGNYTSTVTYTKSPLNCQSVNQAALTVALSSVATSMTVDNVGLTNGTVLSIGAEYIRITDATDAANGIYVIERAQLGTTAATYNIGTYLSDVGAFQAGALATEVVNGTVTTFTTLDNTGYEVGQTLILNDAGYEHVRITAISQAPSNDITVERGVDGTTAVAHAPGTDIIATRVPVR